MRGREMLAIMAPQRMCGEGQLLLAMDTVDGNE